MHITSILPLLVGTSVCKPAASDIRTGCRNIPGDPGWPLKDAWDTLNDTVSGRLISSFPVAHVCHDPTFSSADCKTVNDQWGQLNYMTSQPAEILSTWFQNETCVPYTSPATPCDLGNYPSYIIKVTNTDDIIAGLKFVRKNNIRLVVKNTGHDFYGKSTGKGALSLWMRGLTSMRVIREYASTYYNGPAIKFGAGVTGGDASRFASQEGYRIVVGSCSTVGLAGGYTQGGGHSFLTGTYGFSADNALEWEVVLASGEHVVATPTKHEDLYWAFSGGGGGTFGVVVSMTVRVFPEARAAVASFSFGVSTVGGVDKFWTAVHGFLQNAALLAESHGIALDLGISNETLTVLGLMAPALDAKTLTQIMQPMMSDLSRIGLSQEATNLVVKDSSSYYELWVVTTAPLSARPATSPVYGGRMVSQSNMARNSSAVVAGIRKVVLGGRFTISGTAFNARGSGRLAAPISRNSVQPSLSDAFMSLIVYAAWTLGQDWSNAAKLQDDLMHDLMPPFEAATPGAGVYKNEGNWAQPDFQDIFFGSTYEELQAIKKKYDPNGIFYGVTAVGSEDWTPDEQGRLCRSSA